MESPLPTIPYAVGVPNITAPVVGPLRRWVLYYSITKIRGYPIRILIYPGSECKNDQWDSLRAAQLLPSTVCTKRTKVNRATSAVISWRGVPRPSELACSSCRVPVHWRRKSFSAPAGIRPAQRRPAGAILPGGRIILPEGEQFITGSGPFGLAVSPEGKSVVTANGGPGRNSLTILERDKNRHWDVRHLLARTKGDDAATTKMPTGAASSWGSPSSTSIPPGSRKATPARSPSSIGTARRPTGGGAPST